MSAVHIRLVDDEQGDLVDLIYFHHECSPADVLGWPAPEPTDAPRYCGDPSSWPHDSEAGCGKRIEAVPLTRYGLLDTYDNNPAALTTDEPIEAKGARARSIPRGNTAPDSLAHYSIEARGALLDTTDDRR